MFKLLRTLVIVGLILVAGLFAYDYYMTNSGIENRVRYEIQKHEVRNSDYNPLQETKQERRRRKRRERKEKLKEFFN